jgi:hypothetical protein
MNNSSSADGPPLPELPCHINMARFVAVVDAACSGYREGASLRVFQAYEQVETATGLLGGIHLHLAADQQDGETHHSHFFYDGDGESSSACRRILSGR